MHVNANALHLPDSTNRHYCRIHVNELIQWKTGLVGDSSLTKMHSVKDKDMRGHRTRHDSTYVVPSHLCCTCLLCWSFHWKIYLFASWTAWECETYSNLTALCLCTRPSKPSALFLLTGRYKFQFRINWTHRCYLRLTQQTYMDHKDKNKALIGLTAHHVRMTKCKLRCILNWIKIIWKTENGMTMFWVLSGASRSNAHSAWHHYKQLQIKLKDCGLSKWMNRSQNSK